jgi:hypothetical protein
MTIPDRMLAILCPVLPAMSSVRAAVQPPALQGPGLIRILAIDRQLTGWLATGLPYNMP